MIDDRVPMVTAPARRAPVPGGAVPRCRTRGRGCVHGWTVARPDRRIRGRHRPRRAPRPCPESGRLPSRIPARRPAGFARRRCDRPESAVHLPRQGAANLIATTSPTGRDHISDPDRAHPARPDNRPIAAIMARLLRLVEDDSTSKAGPRGARSRHDRRAPAGRRRDSSPARWDRHDWPRRPGPIIRLRARRSLSSRFAWAPVISAQPIEPPSR